MAEIFTLTVSYKNQQREFDAELRVFGYTHKIAVMVDGVEVLYEPDEERNYRAVIQDDPGIRKIPDAQLLAAIGVELETALR